MYLNLEYISIVIGMCPAGLEPATSCLSDKRTTTVPRAQNSQGRN